MVGVVGGRGTDTRKALRKMHEGGGVKKGHKEGVGAR